MRTEDEVNEARWLLEWYRVRGKVDRRTADNLGGVMACLDWLKGDDAGPVAGTLQDLRDANKKHSDGGSRG